MADQKVNPGRRRFLTASTAVVGAVGAGFVAVPFVASWKPSAKAQVAGAPVTQDISKLEMGQRLIVQWRGQPVWILRRTEDQLAVLPSLDDRLRDPDSQNPDQQPAYTVNTYRSIKPEIAVIVGICTHLGCSPTFVPEMQPQPFDADWKGGFYCPCHNSRFDIAGRVYGGMPAPSNLKVPPHRYIDDNHILIGVDSEGVA